MNILYKNKRVEQGFHSKYKRQWKYPKQVQLGLLSMENYILSATSFMDIVNYPPYRCERLKGKRRNEWSLRVKNTGYRIIFVPVDEEGKEIVRGDILRISSEITSILIKEVSNHYE